MQRVQLQARVGKPFGEPPDCRFIVVIEMRAGGAQLNRLKPVSRDMDKMLARQPRLVKQVGGYAKTVVWQTTILQAPDFRLRAFGP